MYNNKVYYDYYYIGYNFLKDIGGIFVKLIYFIGYLLVKFNDFLEIFKSFKILVFVDVRINFFLRFVLEYRKENLEKVLK